MATRGPQMLTANRLRDGEVVWWKDGSWVEAMRDAQIFTERADADVALKEAERFVATNIVVNPYLFEVRLNDGKAVPVEEREVIRAGGPSIHENLGKQAVHV